MAELSSQPFAAPSGPRGKTMFVALPPDVTGIKTENRYADPEMWNRRYHEFEIGPIGTGVAVGDYDGDGRPDLFIVSKTESCRLFRNLGGWRFEDVTARAGVADEGDAAVIWKEGATFVDVNNDGRLDIYLCRFDAPNRLYINQGDGTFKDEARAYGLDVRDGSTMAAFCDYDRDGWLDMYLQTNLLNNAQHPGGQRDYLFHNNGNGTFTNVTEPAGIRPEETQGNSATWWDYDGDGWPDLYVANDFAQPDFLYHNNRDGTFSDVTARVAPQTPYSAMGADVGDVNNDGRLDFLVADMAATTHQKDQRTMADTRARTKDVPDALTDAPQFLYNTLLVNTGTGHMLEAAHLAGVAATDWTWSPRFEDLDDDGRVDLTITNGMHREIHNADLILRMMTAETAQERVRIARASPVLAERNLAYRNRGDFQFEDVSAAWGLDKQGVSFGSAFGDLDGDGDLDLVFTNYQEGATVLRNDCDSGHRVIFALRGKVSNRFGIGATVRIETAHGQQVRPLMLARGYMSSSEPVAHFGLGDDAIIRRVSIAWPSGREQTFANLAADRRYTIVEPSSENGSPQPKGPPPQPEKRPPQFSDVSAAVGFAIASREEPIDELAQQRLLPVRFNRRGPALAVGNVAGDGDDVIIGGTTLDPVRVLLRGDGSSYRLSPGRAPASDPTVNDGPLLVFDADGDGNADVLVNKGGVTQPAGAAEYQPVLFVGDGKGSFRAADGAVPPLALCAGAAAAADFNRDGRLDVFIGARVMPGMYPTAPASALLVNRGGRFEDVTDALAPALRNVGMVTGALWSDVDGDGWPDLLVTLEWGMVRYFHNNAGQGFDDRTKTAGFATAGAGWWTGITAADFNDDGRPDYVVGNLGLNTQYHADPQHPARLFYGDFQGDGTPQLIEAYYEGEKLYPWRARRDLGAVIPSILKHFPRNDAYARATLEEIVGADKLAAADQYAATELRSGVFLSQADGTYRFTALPRIAQVAPWQGVVAGDFDGDGEADIYAVQNSYAPNPVTGRFDGGLGQFLQGDGRGNFAAVPADASGLVVTGDAKALVVVDLDHDGWPDFLVSRNNGRTLAFHNHGVPGRHSIAVRLHGPPGNPTAVGAHVTAVYADHSTRRMEVYAGSGYYGQSTPAQFLGSPSANPLQSVRVEWPDGTRTTTSAAPGAAALDVTR